MVLVLLRRPGTKVNRKGSISRVLLLPRQNAISLKSLRHQYDVIVVTVTYLYDVIGIGAGQTVYAMLHQIFSDIKKN